MIRTSTNCTNSQKMPSVENSLNVDIKSLVSDDSKEKYKIDEDALSFNQIPETISSGSSINIMVSSSSSCGNVGSSSSSSLGNQDEAKNNLLKEQTGPVVGSELSSSSRRSSISGDMETKISKESSKASKSLRKPKRVSPSKNRKARRLTRKKRDVHNEDADDDESDNVFDESGNDSALEKDFGEKTQAKFNCLDLDLFDYLLKRNFLKSMNQNQSDVKMLNSTAKQRKLSLFTASSDFKDFENNLNINKYFYELIKNGKKNLDNISHMDENVKTIDPQVFSLMNDLVSQVEKNTLPKQTSLIKTLLHDMSSLNSIGSNDESKKVPSVELNTENMLAHDEKSSKENIEIQEETKQVESNITKEDELKSMEKTSLNTKLLNSCVNDKETNLVEVEEEKKENMSEIGKLTSGQLASKSDIVTELNGNVKKVILKNNEVVLIEDCLDDEHEEEMRLKLLKLNNKNAQDLISDTVTPVPRRDKTDSMSKSQTFSMPKPSKSAGKDDDPYVKAALERFDAFCKSKSSHNLDQSATTPSFVLNRQKSPYLTRKLSATSQSEADPSVKESVSSFIKRRSARIDPNKADLTSRSASESRADSNKPFSSSSLAKKFLGSLGPQLDPPDLPPKPTKPENLVLDNSKTNSTCTSPSCSDTNSSSGQNSPTSSPTHQTKSKLIKLEVLNSKNRSNSAKVSETKHLSNSPGTNKPPIPPSQALVQSNKAKNLKNTEVTIEKNPKIQNSKPVSRIIPIEIKNSKNSTNAKVAGQRTPTKSVDRDIVSSEVDKNDTQSSPSIQDRIRSLSTSFRENLNERKFVRENSIGDPTSPRQADNIYDSLIRENPIADHKPDPIVEKACNNFMTKLKEFQRLHSSQSLSYTSPPSSSISTSSSYSGPIVSARNTNPASVDYSSSAPSYKSLYSSTYSTPMSSSYYEPASYTKYENELSSSPRPYVSAIRKRRTLFSDGFDSASTELRTDSADEFVSYTKSESDYSQYSARSEYDESKIAQARNRPLSIVSEESNAAVARSHTINNTRVKEPVKSLKKSNSINQASKTESKIRSTVFDRLSVNPTCESKACTKSSSSLSSKPPANYDIKKKEENEIAVVNSVVPKTRRESTSSIGNPSTNSSSNINRIRSLDPKNRDKFKSTASLKQNTKSNATNVAASSTNVPACYLYPCPDPKQTGVLKSASNTSTKSSEESKRKTTNKNLAENKKDVFERLSKRANSMKNLSNKSKNSSSSSSSGEEADHKALGDENDDSVFHSSQNSGSGKTSVFERLYKSNIAAHMSQDEAKNTSLKKNMSVSSANLISNGQSSHQNSARKSNLSKNKGFINTRVSLRNRKDDSANDESNESKISDSETIKNESPRDLTKSSFLCKKLIDLYDK